MTFGWEQRKLWNQFLEHRMAKHREYLLALAVVENEFLRHFKAQREAQLLRVNSPHSRSTLYRRFRSTI